VVVWGAFGRIYSDRELEKRIEDYERYKDSYAKAKNEEFVMACPLFGNPKTGQQRVPSPSTVKYKK